MCPLADPADSFVLVLPAWETYKHCGTLLACQSALWVPVVCFDSFPVTNTRLTVLCHLFMSFGCRPLFLLWNRVIFHQVTRRVSGTRQLFEIFVPVQQVLVRSVCFQTNFSVSLSAEQILMKMVCVDE